MEFLNHGRATNYMLPVLAIDQITVSYYSVGDPREITKGSLNHFLTNFQTSGMALKHRTQTNHAELIFFWGDGFGLSCDEIDRIDSEFITGLRSPICSSIPWGQCQQAPWSYPPGRWRARSGEIQLWKDFLPRKHCCPEHHDKNRVLFQVHPNAGAFLSQFQGKTVVPQSDSNSLKYNSFLPANADSNIRVSHGHSSRIVIDQ